MEFKDLEDGDMEIEGPSNFIPPPKNAPALSKEHLLTKKVESLMARLDTWEGTKRFHPYQRNGN